MRRALRSALLCAAMGTVARGETEAEVAVDVGHRELQRDGSAAAGLAANELFNLAAKNFLSSGWGEQFQKIATGAELAKETSDTQAFLDTLINTASPEGPNGQPALFTLELNSNPATNEQNINRLYGSLFGQLPTQDKVGDLFTAPESFMDVPNKIQDMISAAGSGGTGGLNLECAWTVTVSTERVNVALPDKQSLYHAHLLQNFGPDDMLVIEGEFPDVRYFSFIMYDENYNAVAGLRDHQITPVSGLNPWAQPVKDKAENGKYRIYITKDGKGGFPNEIAASRVGAGSGTAFLLFRLYANDVDITSTDQTLADWGWKQPPTISYKSSQGGLLPTNTGMKLTQLAKCSSNNTDIAFQAFQTVMGLNSPGNQSTQNCVAENVKDGWVLFARDQDSDANGRAPFTNADGAYLVACANNRNAYVGSNELVAVIRDYLPKTPYSKYSPRYTGDIVNNEVRYVSFGIYDLKMPGPNIDSIYDKHFHDFYYAKYGAAQWEEKFGRNISLVIAKNAQTLTRCGISTEKSLTMFLENEQQKEVPQWWGIIYREIVPQTDIVNASTSQKQYGIKPDRLYKKSVSYAKKQMCPSTKNCDTNPWRVGSYMKEHFPRIDWYFCSVEGVLTVAPPSAHNFDTNYPLSDGPDNDDQYYSQFCDGKTNDALVKVYAPSTASVHYHQAKVTSSPANTLLASPITIKTAQKDIVIGVSVAAGKPDDAYFKADVSVCGFSYVSEPTKWRCTNAPTPDDAWLSADFDDSAWAPAAVKADKALSVPGISGDAEFITSSVPSSITVCRVVVPNPTFLG